MLVPLVETNRIQQGHAQRLQSIVSDHEVVAIAGFEIEPALPVGAMIKFFLSSEGFSLRLRFFKKDVSGVPLGRDLRATAPGRSW